VQLAPLPGPHGSKASPPPFQPLPGAPGQPAMPGRGASKSAPPSYTHLPEAGPPESPGVTCITRGWGFILPANCMPGLGPRDEGNPVLDRDTHLGFRDLRCG
jgi:hypothetical protein